jgi:uncharacterized protein YdbL (DUF1318 family)
MLMLLCAPLATFAASKQEIIERQRKRLPEIAELKGQGKVGETDKGLVEAVEGSAPAVIEEENTDRRELYAIIAKETNASVEQVAKQVAQRNFQRAKKGEFLKFAGEWRKKA